LYATATVGDRTYIAALSGKTRQNGAVEQEADYRFTTVEGSKSERCTEPGKCTTILLLYVPETLMYQHVQRFE